MIKAEISLADLGQDMRFVDGEIVFGSSHISPYAHEALEAFLVRTQDRWFAMVRERRAGVETPDFGDRVLSPEAFEDTYRKCLLWGLDYLIVEGANIGRRIKVRCGVHGTVPVYCRAYNDRVTVSWDFSDLLTHVLTIDPEIAAHSLALETFYSARQLCTGIYMLTERSVFYAEPGGARYQYPPPYDTAAHAALPDDTDYSAAYEESLRRAVSARSISPGRIAIELSGGMDSAVVAASLSSLHGGMASRGVLLDGDFRKAQLHRRDRIVDHLGLDDEVVEMRDYLPSMDLSNADYCRKSPHKEFYFEAFSAMWRNAGSDGLGFVFTGIGGDELFMPSKEDANRGDASWNIYYSEVKRLAEGLLRPAARDVARTARGFDAPASPVSLSSLMAQACQAPHLLERGLWQISPLSDPSLVAFCLALPPELRQHRELARRYACAHLGEDLFPRGYAKEHFADVLPAVVADNRAWLLSQLQECALADIGLVDHAAVLALVEYVADTRSTAAMSPLASFLWMERFVRQVC